MRASITSSTPWLNVVHWRGKPGLVGLVATIVTPGVVAEQQCQASSPSRCCWSSGRRCIQDVAASERAVATPGSPTVASFPSRWPLRIAACGRQKLNVYLASQHAIPASDAARYMSARVLAVSDRSRPRASMICRATPFQIADGVPSQNRAISVCVGRPRRAGERPDLLDFAVVARVAAAVERGRAVGTELRAALGSPTE